MKRKIGNSPLYLTAVTVSVMAFTLIFPIGCAEEPGSAAPAGTTQPPATTEPPPTTTPPIAVGVTTDPDPDENKGFMGVSAALDAKLKQIVVDNPVIKELLAGHDHRLRFGTQEIVKQTYNIATGALLKEGVNIQTWLQTREDPRLIARYIGVLNIGYGGSYFLAFDDGPAALTKIVFQRAPSADIPQLATADMQKALDIGWADPLVQELLKDKTWAVDSEQIGVIQEGPQLMGISFKITFDKSYAFDAILPVPAPYEPRRFQGDGVSMYVNVTFAEAAVTAIMIMPF